MKGKFIFFFLVIIWIIAACKNGEVHVKEEKPKSHPVIPNPIQFEVDWSQKVESELCETLRKCRDLGDEYGSDDFEIIYRELTKFNGEWILSSGTEDEDFNLSHQAIVAQYKYEQQDFHIVRGTEEIVFQDITGLLIDLFDFDFIELNSLNFLDGIIPYVIPEQQTLSLPSDQLIQWQPPYTVRILLHEYAHLLSMQKEEYEILKDCPTNQFTVHDMCFSEDSYLNKYYETFLKGYDKQWLSLDVDTVDARIQFYEENEELFLTTYASVNPLEDFAESFVHFMLTPYEEPAITIAESKKQFFYQFPELVEYRARVWKMLVDRKIQNRDYY